jgi:hypothetical protein
MPGRAATAATGAASGLLNGAFGTGGPPVILFYFASPAGATAGRASLIAYFLGTDILAMPFLAHQGLVTREAFIRSLIFLPALLAGVALGARGFRAANPQTFRRFVLAILALLAVLTAAQGAGALLRAGHAP